MLEGKHYLKKRDDFSITGLYFRKTGQQIVEQVHKELGKLETTIGFISNKATELCTKYRLKWDEVVSEERQRQHEKHLSFGGRVGMQEESEDSRGPSTRYATSAYENASQESDGVPFKDQKENVRKVERDLGVIGSYVTLLFKTEDRRDEFRRIVNNLNQADIFEFDYSELKELGFE